MKKLLLTILFISILTFSLTAAATVKFKETTIDFGDAESGKVVDVVYEFENTGDSILIIKNISTSCGCTAAKIEKKEYQPGEKGQLPVKFNTRGYNGRVTKTITVSTNDEENAYSRLKVTGNIILKDFATLQLSNDHLKFEEVKFGEEYKEVITITNAGTIDLRIVEVAHNPDLIPEFEKKVLKPKENMKLLVRFKPMQSGPFTSFLKIRSNDIKHRLMIVRVSAKVEETGK